MIGKKLLAAFGVALLGAGLMGVPALAKCNRTCRSQIATALRDCKKTCAKGKAGKACRKTCNTTKTASITKCRKATPPACSPSGAFLDDLSGF